MSVQYIHYGSENFETSRFMPIVNNPLDVKPCGGLWASPIHAEYGWRKWCEKEKFKLGRLRKSFLFTVKENTIILYVNYRSDLDRLPQIKLLEMTAGINLRWVILDFEKMLEDGIDAIQLNLSNDENLYWALYDWDCDCLLVMNKDVIVPEAGR